MESVQGLLLAAQAKRKPNAVASMAENLLAGYANAQQNSIDRTRKLLENEMLRKQIENQEMMRRQAQAQLSQFQEDDLSQGLRQTSPRMAPVLPKQKLEVGIKQNEKGLYSFTYKTKEPNKTNQQVPPIGYRWNEEGNLEAIPGGPAEMKKQKPPPAGYRWTESGDLEFIPGGPIETKKTVLKQKEGKLLTSAESKYDDLIKEAEAIRDNPSLEGAVGFDRLRGAVPGTSAYGVKARINTLKSKTGFSVLQEMRASSPTGGALGSVTERENQMLQDNISTLDTGQGIEDFKASLNRIIDFARASKNRIRETYDGFYSDVPDDPAARNTPTTSETPDQRKARLLKELSGAR